MQFFRGTAIWTAKRKVLCVDSQNWVPHSLTFNNKKNCVKLADRRKDLVNNSKLASIFMFQYYSSTLGYHLRLH